MILALLLLFTILLCISGARIVAGDFLSPLALFTYMAVAVFLLRPIFLISGLAEFYAPELLKDDLNFVILKATLIFVFAYLAVLLGYLSSQNFGRALAKNLPRFRKPPNFALLAIITTLGLLLAAIIYLSALRQYGSVGGVMIAARTGLWQGNQLSGLLNQNTSALAAIAFAVARAHDKKAVSHFFLGALIISLFITGLLGDRSGIVVPIAVLVIAYHYSGWWRLSYIKFGSIIVAILLISSMLGGLRGLVMFESRVNDAPIETISNAKNIARKVSSGGNLQTYDYFLVVIQDSEKLELLGGEHFWKGIVAVIPRFFWEGKPENISAGAWFNEHFGSIGGGKPFTNIGVWYVNFGIIGLVLGMMLSGIVLRILNEWRRKSKSFWAHYYIAWVTFLVFIGGITPALPTQIIKWALPLYIFYLLASVSNKPRLRKPYPIYR